MISQIQELPILFKAPLVKAILNTKSDRTPIDPNKPIKWQTRRVVKSLSNPRIAPLEMQPWVVDGERQLDKSDRPCWVGTHPDYPSGEKWFSCPYGKPKNRLWVQETWFTDKRYDDFAPTQIPEEGRDRIWYLADGEPPNWVGRKRVAIHMPRWASRLTLEVSEVRVERLQSIRNIDIPAEGIAVYEGNKLVQPTSLIDIRIYVDQWIKLWDNINVDRGFGWDKNPWVWVIEFSRLDA